MGVGPMRGCSFSFCLNHLCHKRAIKSHNEMEYTSHPGPSSGGYYI